MSAYTDAASRAGRQTNPQGTDPRALFLVEFGGMVITSYDEIMDYDDLRFKKQIKSGKAESFPVIGRKRDATEHEVGEQILGGRIEHDEVVITMDNILVDAVFIPEIDELLAHYSFAEPYAHQIGQSLGSTTSRRIAIMHILASRDITDVPTGQPAPAYYWNADLRTDASKMEDFAFKAAEYLRTNDILGTQPQYMLPHQQVLIMARYTGIEGGPVSTGSANRAAGTIGDVAGLKPKGTNHIPKTNITTGLAKYRGDFTDTVGHISSKMAVGSLERRALKMTMKDQDDRLGTLIIGSQLSGHGTLRNECSIEGRVSAIGGRASL